METEQLLAQFLLRHEDTPGGLMPLLQDIQEALGYIPQDVVPAVAEAMNLSAAEVHGVISFYHDFRTSPAGRHRVQLCLGESCQAMGARELETHALKQLGIAMGGTTADDSITLEPVYCLGNCACSPSLRIDDQLYARVDAERLDALFAPLKGPEEGA